MRRELIYVPYWTLGFGIFIGQIFGGENRGESNLAVAISTFYTP
jgi:hypothetical protein